MAQGGEPLMRKEPEKAAWGMTVMVARRECKQVSGKSDDRKEGKKKCGAGALWQEMEVH